MNSDITKCPNRTFELYDFHYNYDIILNKTFYLCKASFEGIKVNLHFQFSSDIKVASIANQYKGAFVLATA